MDQNEEDQLIVSENKHLKYKEAHKDQGQLGIRLSI